MVVLRIMGTMERGDVPSERSLDDGLQHIRLLARLFLVTDM